MLYGYLACFDGIAIGCIAALLKHKFLLPLFFRKISLIFLLGVAFIYFQGGILSNVVWGISGMSICVGLFLLTSGAKEEAGFFIRAFSPLRFIGRYSYEIYLFHIVLLALIKTTIAKEDMGIYQKQFLFAAFIGLSIAVAYFISRYFSEPCNKKIRNYVKAQA